MGPSTMAEARVPHRIAICCDLGVDPTRKPVFKSCETVPPFDEAIQTIAPIDNAVTKYCGPVQPMSTKARHVRSNVATVIPDVGDDDETQLPEKGRENKRHQHK